MKSRREGLGLNMATKVYKTSNGMEIPDWAIKSMASCLLPIIRQYYATEEGRRAFAEWKAKQLATKDIPSKDTNKGEASNASPLSHTWMSLLNLTKPKPSPMGISLGFG